MKKLFGRQEDREFSKVVLEYNALEEGSCEKLMLEGKVKERTKVLLYLIPQRCMFIKEEDASAFFIEIVKDLDKIIDAFRISGLTYNGYLAQICRYRCMQFMKKKQFMMMTERAVLYSDPSICTNESSMNETAVEYRSIDYAEEIRKLDFAETIHRIITEMNAKAIRGNEKEEKLRLSLTRKTNRRRFLTFLLTLPEEENERFISAVSRVLSADDELVAQFFHLKHERLMENEDERREAENAVGRYWTAMARLRHAMTMETDADKTSKLEDAYKRSRRIYESRRKKLAKARRGMTQKQISGMLGLPRSTISNDICRIREILESIDKMVKI